MKIGSIVHYSGDKLPLFQACAVVQFCLSKPGQ